MYISQGYISNSMIVELDKLSNRTPCYLKSYYSECLNLLRHFYSEGLNSPHTLRSENISFSSEEKAYK